MLETIKQIISLPFEDPVLIFSTVLIIILLSPVIFDRLRIPHIVGLILAGIVCGPHAVHILDYDSSFKLFGQVGVLYIMFLAGIDVDMNDFRRNRKKSIVFGTLTFLIPMLLGTLTGIVLLYCIFSHIAPISSITWLAGDVSTNETFLKYCSYSAIVLASMYASNTLIAYPIVTRLGVSRSRSVNITVGGTMITTLLALLVLAVILEIVKGDMSSAFWIKFGISITVYGLIMIFLLPMVCRWFFKRYEDSVLQYIFVLCVVFLSSFLAKLAGVEYIIGAFMAGIMLNRLVPKHSPLMSRIDFVGNAIFIPFFLISVGMIVDLHVLFSNYWTLIAAIVMSFIATLAKYLAAKSTQKMFKMSQAEGQMIFGLSNAQAAATLAAVTIAYEVILGHGPNGEEIRLLPKEVLNGTIVMILVTCAISSFLTERSAKKLVVEDTKNAIDEATYTPEHRILIPVSNPYTINDLVSLALSTRDKNEKQPIYALNVVDENSNDSSKVIQGKKLLETAASYCVAADAKVKLISRYDLNIASGISNVVKEKNISDVIIGLHNQASATDSFFGNIAETLLNRVNRTVCIYKSVQPIGTIQKLVVVTPAMAEYESGFAKWTTRTFTLSRQIGAEIDFYAFKDTIEALKAVIKKRKISVKIKFYEIAKWEDFQGINKKLAMNDLLMVIASRKPSISYTPLQEKIPEQLSTLFYKNSYMVLYPEQFKEGEIDRPTADTMHKII